MKDLPRHHSSSPCKPFCSEPQRTLLAVELQILILFNMLASMFYSFSMFSQGFLPAMSSFPQTVSSISLVFSSGFSKLVSQFFLQFKCFFRNFSPFSSFPPVFNALPSFSLVFPTFCLPCSRDLRGIEPHHHQIALWHMPPKKLYLSTLITTLYRDFGLTGQRPPPHPLYSLRSRKQLCLA